jgi:hypothetical protein
MTCVFTPNIAPSGRLGGAGYGLTFEVVNQPEGALLMHSPGTFGHGGGRRRRLDNPGSRIRWH